MRVIWRSVVVAAIAAIPSYGTAQVLTEKNVSLQLAKTIADGAIAACKRDGFDVSAVVVDRHGIVRLMYRNDAAGLHNTDLARRKAYTARTFRSTSLQIQKLTNGDAVLSGQRFLPNVIGLGGGVPIMAGNEPIGGLGVSGTPSQEADEKCALAGLATVADQLR